MLSRGLTLAALLGGLSLPGPAHATAEGQAVLATDGASALPPRPEGPAQAVHAFERAQDLHRRARLPLTREQRRGDGTYRAAVQARLDLFGAAHLAYRDLDRFGAGFAVVSACGQGLLLEEMAAFLRSEPAPPAMTDVDRYEIAMLRQSIPLYRTALARYREAQRAKGSEDWSSLAAKRARAVAKILRDARSRLNALDGAPA